MLKPGNNCIVLRGKGKRRNNLWDVFWSSYYGNQCEESSETIQMDFNVTHLLNSLSYIKGILYHTTEICVQPCTLVGKPKSDLQN